MASSRTGTAAWFKVRDERRRLALEQGVYRCPLCKVGLDWIYSGRPNSVEIDHIIPHAMGGSDVIENTRAICRHCNASLGGRANKGHSRKPKPVVTPLKTSRRQQQTGGGGG